jgi:hypothetical protein
MYSRSSKIQSKLSNKIPGVLFLSLAIIISSHNPIVAKSSDFGMCHDQKLQVSTKPARAQKKFYLKKSDGVYIVSDRQETFATSFQRRHIVAGKTIREYLPEVLEAGTTEQGQCFVSYPSYNDDKSGKVTTYGIAFKLAPIPPEVLQLWKNRPKSNISWTTILLERDSQDAKLYHFVGWAEKDQFSFFSEETKGDSIAFGASGAIDHSFGSDSGRKSLWYQGK